MEPQPSTTSSADSFCETTFCRNKPAENGKYCDSCLQFLRQQLKMSPRFARATFETFEQADQPVAYAAAEAFTKRSADDKPWLYLFGRSGSGKTHLAAAIANQAMNAKFVTVPELLLEIKKTFRDGTEDGLLDSLSKTKLLILDDLGSEKPTEWVQETMFVLIDRRYTHYLPTIITSNFSLDQLKDRLGYRIASRIAEMSQMVELRPRDFRIKKTR